VVRTEPLKRPIPSFELSKNGAKLNFYDASGVPGVVYREASEGWKGNRHRFLYIRADLLRRYLARTRQKLVWCNWGERDWLAKEDGYAVGRNPTRGKILREHSHIHRAFKQWTD